MKKTFQIALEPNASLKVRDVIAALRTAADSVGSKVTVKLLTAATPSALTAKPAVTQKVAKK